MVGSTSVNEEDWAKAGAHKGGGGQRKVVYTFHRTAPTATTCSGFRSFSEGDEAIVIPPTFEGVWRLPEAAIWKRATDAKVGALRAHDAVTLMRSNDVPPGNKIIETKQMGVQT